MVAYVAFEPDTEVSGKSMLSFLEGAGRYAPMTYKLLVESGAHRLKGEDWFPMQRLLDAYRQVAESVGEQTLFVIGRRVLETAILPPDIDSIEAALAAMDVAYHLNHRIDGQAMFDLATGIMKEGIGHYHYRPGGGRHAIMVCNNPYPSEFDRGIITGMARKFKPSAEVILDETQPTRKQGADECTYIVKW